MYTHILHATDLSENHYVLCEKAAKLAKYHKAELYLLHVIEIPSSFILAQNLGFMELIKPHQDDALIVLKTIGESLHVPVKHQFVETGDVKRHILEKATTLQCDLIILGKHTNLLGDHVDAITHHASKDVLVLS